jgi:hypothetical protein
VLEVRPSSSRPEAGIVRVRTVGYKQDGTTVIEYERTVMVYRREHLPSGKPVNGTRVAHSTTDGQEEADSGFARPSV